MIVLGIDQARRSGWAVHDGRKIVQSGFVYNTPGMIGVVELVKAHAGSGGISSVLVVYEDHSGIPLHAKTRFQGGQAPTRNTATILGMGAAWGRWETALDLAGHNPRLRICVAPADWRLRVLGLVPSASTERCKATAKAWASQAVQGNVEDDNEAEAIAIASWGALDGKARLEAQRQARRMKDYQKRQAAKQGGLPW